MREPRGQELVERYRANYHLPVEATLTEEMVLRHWDLERHLRQRLLEATPDDRWEVFDSCYSELYRRLVWLNRLDSSGSIDESTHKLWISVIGPPPQRVYEVGSGQGELISYIAANGYDCSATEITRERGQALAPAPNVHWSVTDGIHVARFEEPGSFDVVLTDQVIEHLHPEDVLEHLRNVWEILTDDGRYIIATPNAAGGPADVSRVFGATKPVGMHLKEYTYSELAQLLRRAGFRDVAAILRLPARMRGKFDAKPIASTTYLRYLQLLERLLLHVPIRWRSRAVRLARFVLFTDNMMVVAQKA